MLRQCAPLDKVEMRKGMAGVDSPVQKYRFIFSPVEPGTVDRDFGQIIQQAESLLQSQPIHKVQQGNPA